MVMGQVEMHQACKAVAPVGCKCTSQLIVAEVKVCQDVVGVRHVNKYACQIIKTQVQR
jgi:hypothetical protein